MLSDHNTLLMIPGTTSDLVWCLVALVLILLLVIVNQRRRIFMQLSDLRELKDQKSELKATLSSQSCTLSVQMSFIIKSISQLAETTDRIPSSTPEGKRLKRLMENQLEYFRSRQATNMIIESVNNSHDGIVDTLRMACPILSEPEILLYALTVMELHQDVICTLIGIKRSTYFSRRKSITDAITEAPTLSPEHKALLLKYFTENNPQTTAQ